MSIRRYRVRFHVRFDHEIDAGSIAEARFIAEDMKANAWPPLLTDMLSGEHDLQCAWSYIEPLGEVGDEDGLSQAG